MGIAAGIIIAWPSTAASIPSGWARKTALDNKYPRAAASAGGSGGSADHSHSIGSHSHSIATHSHSLSGSPQAADVEAEIELGAVLSTSEATSHTHLTASSTNSASPSNPGSSSPSAQTNDNDLPHWKTIFIESNGDPEGIPDGALALWAETDELPSGWTQPTNGKGRYLKGAATGADGGATAGALSHGHTANSHSHNDASGHVHPNNLREYIGTPRAGNSGFDHSVVDQEDTPGGNHYHTHPGETDRTYCDLAGETITVNSASKQEPSYRAVGIVQNATGDDDLLIGIIGFWGGSPASIPSGWHLCDGSGDCPDWDGNEFLKGSTTLGGIGATGGYATPSHTHTTASHNHGGTAYHTHTQGTWDEVYSLSGAATGTDYAVIANHYHTIGTVVIAAASPTVGSAAPALSSETNAPPYYDLILVQYTGAAARLSTSHTPFGQTVRVFDDGVAGDVSFERRDLPSGSFSTPTQPFGAGSNCPDIECLADGRLRCAIVDSDGNLQQYYSSDDGETWA